MSESLLGETMQDELKNLEIGEIRFEEPMTQWTSLRIGGTADVLAFPQDEAALAKLCRWIQDHKLPFYVMGSGSNLLVKDGGVRGVMIHLGKGFREFKIFKNEGDGVELYAESGVRMPMLVEWALKEGYAGLEVLTGIPGSIGGALAMNAGTREGCIGDLVKEVTVLDKEGVIKSIPRSKLEFEYRQLKTKTGTIFLSTTLTLKKGDRQEIEATIKRIKTKRSETQPLNLPNAGSIFKNPKQGFAARLIEEAGLKGVRVGKARISEKHANWIVNEGGATARDVLALIGLAKDKVKEKFGVMLETEIRMVGNDV